MAKTLIKIPFYFELVDKLCEENGLLSYEENLEIAENIWDKFYDEACNLTDTKTFVLVDDGYSNTNYVGSFKDLLNDFDWKFIKVKIKVNRFGKLKLIVKDLTKNKKFYFKEKGNE
jgi:hypothetical protein